MNKSMLKVSVLFIFLLLLIASISTVLSGTVTIDGDTFSSDSSDIIIHYTDGWIKVDNATIDGESVNSTVINQWALAYTQRGDLWYNASASATIDSALMAEWNSSYDWGDHSLIGYLTSLGDPWFNASVAATIDSPLMAEWNSSYDWGDHSGLYSLLGHLHDFNYSGYNQDLNTTNDTAFNKLSTPNIDTVSGGLNITSDDAYTRVTGDLNVTGILSPTFFLIPCYGAPPAAVNGMMYLHTGNNSLVVYYAGSWHWYEET